MIEYIAIRPGPARQLAAGLRQAGEEAAASRDRIAAILAEGGESAPLMERRLTDVASWAQELAGDIEWRVEAMVALDGASPSSPGLLSGVLPSTEAEAARVVLRAELERRYTETRQEIETALAQTTAAIGAGSGDMEALRTRELTLVELLQDPSRQFLEFDNAGDGRAVEVFGDLAAADHVSWFVPGITNTLDNFSAATAHNASNIQEQALRLGQGANVATIAWLGYDTPGHSDAILTAAAGEGAPALREHIEGLGLAEGVTTTVVAHSYGSLVTGTALRQGLEVDNVVAIGSPGMGRDVDHVDDFGLPEGTDFYAAMAPLDGINLSEWHGPDPSDPRFGSTRLQTGAGDEGLVWWHSDYTMRGSASLENLGWITLDQDDRVLVAPPTPRERVVIASEELQALAGRGLEAADDGVDAGQSTARDAAGWIGERIDASQEMVAEDNEGVPVAEQVTAVGNRAVDGLQWAGDRVAQNAHDQIDAVQDGGRLVAQAGGAVVDRGQEAVDKLIDIQDDLDEMVEHQLERLPWRD